MWGKSMITRRSLIKVTGKCHIFFIDPRFDNQYRRPHGPTEGQTGQRSPYRAEAKGI